MRDSDSRSSISRAMRVACPCMMARNFSRAARSSLAGPCKVSMKPSSAASGVRNSWLALAMKSARISSTRRSGVRSLNVISRMSERPSPTFASFTGVTKASNQRSSGTRSKNSTRCGVRLAVARRIASTSSGMRKVIKAGSPRRSDGAIVDAAALKAMTRPSRSSTIAGPGNPPISDFDQQGLRMRGGAVVDRQHTAAVSGSAPSLPSNASQAPRRRLGQSAPRGRVCAVVFARHGQSALVFSASISLRIGALAVTAAVCGSGRTPRILSTISRAPKMTSAMTNGTK